MIEQAFLDLPQYNVYTNSLTPLVHYFKEHKNSIPTEDEINKLIPYAKQTDFILTTFHEIIDDLNYDKDNLYHMFKQRFADDVNWVTKNRNNYGIV
jgi:hypothetical protein